MRIAVLSDVHGNLLALEAVLERVDALAPDLVLNLGDCVSGPLWPVETLALLRSRPISCVRGNHDREVGEAAGRPPSRSDAFAWDRLDADARACLREMPESLNEDGLFCVHGRPGSDIDYLVEDVVGGGLERADLSVVADRVGPTEARVVLCGHSHQPQLLRLPSGTLVINPGSVGWQAYTDDAEPIHISETSAPHARFALLDVSANAVDVVLQAVTYDWEAAARQAEANGRLDWAHELRTGLAIPIPPDL